MLASRKIWTVLAAAVATLALASTASAATYPANFDERTLVDGLRMPVAVAWTPDGHMLIAEKSGQLKVVAPGSNVATQIYDMGDRVNAYGDRGMLGVAVDANFNANRFIYVLYTAEANPASPDGGGPMISRLARLTLNPDFSVASETTILGTRAGTSCPAPSNTVDCIPSEGSSHSIGTVRAAPDGTLYVGSGDAASFSAVDPTALRTYDEQSLNGKILHIDRNGRGLASHPFCSSDADLTHVCTKLYAKGFRNPFRFTVRPGGGSGGGLIVGDVGWGTKEEVDVISSGGGDYGWPCYEAQLHTSGYSSLGGCGPEYAKEGGPNAALYPAYSYDHTGGNAVVGGPVYTGSTYAPSFTNKVFFGDYAATGLNYMNLDGSGVTPFGSGWSGVDLQQDPASNLAFVSFGTPGASDGSVREIVYTRTGRAPVAQLDAAPTSGLPPLAVNFDASRSSDPDGEALDYTWNFGDGATAGPSATPTTSHRYTRAGSYVATVTVRDPVGHVATASKGISVGNNAPRASIDAPASGSTYRDGQTVQLRGSATDLEDGSPPASAYSWDVTLHHANHTHPIVQPVGTKTPSFEARTDHDADCYYEITLTVTDAGGVTDTEKAFLYPEKVAFQITSSPPGAPISYGGRDYTAPFTGPSAIGFKTSVSAADSFLSGGRAYRFSGWSDGGARLHDIAVPATPQTVTATYSVVDGAGSVGVGVAAVGPPAGDRPPSVSITPSPATTVPRRPVTLTTKTSDADGSVLGLVFDYNGDGVYESSVPPLHGAVPATSTATKAFPSAGRKTVRVRATDDKGATSTAQATVVVHFFAVRGSVSKGQTLARIKSKGVKAKSTCPYGCRLRATLTLDPASSRKLGLASGTSRPIDLGAAKKVLSAGATKTFNVKPRAGMARKLRSVAGMRLTLRLTATDRAGNRRTEPIAVRLSG